MVATTATRSPFGFACGFLVHLVLSPLLIYLALRARLPNLRIFGKLRGLFAASLILAGIGRIALPYIHGIPSLVAWVLLAVSGFLSLALALDRALRTVVIGFVTGWLSTRRRQAA